MSVSKLKRIIIEEVRKVRLESAMSELGVLMDEARNFEDFVSKIKSNPKFKDIDISSPDVKEFLQSMWDREMEMGSTMGMAAEGKVSKSLIQKLVRESVNKKLSEGLVDYKEVTTEQFMKMLQQIKQEKLFPNAKWGFKGSAGGGTQYIPFAEFIKRATELVQYHKSKGDPITNFYVWNIESPGLSYSDSMKVVNAGADSVVQFGQTQGDKVTKISTSWDSKDSEEFAKAMGRGDFGPLD